MDAIHHATTPHEPGGSLAAAIRLGWRVAELFASIDDPGRPSSDTLLPAHGGLDRDDQLELQLRAAAGDALRAGATSPGASPCALVERLRGMPVSPEATDGFRRELRSCHVELQKDLWAKDEAIGKAYELGNSLSDTYGRICRAYRREEQDPASAWMEVFLPARIERIKKLLDDLQSRLDAGAVAIVRGQLERWCDEVPQRLAGSRVPDEARVREGVRRQTIVWRQLLTGDKQPEAYLDRHARAELRDEIRRLMWRRCRAWIIPLVGGLFGLLIALPELVSLYRDGMVQTGLGSAIVAACGALGITRAYVLLTIRGRIDEWSELVWNRALAQKVLEVTLTLDEAVPPGPSSRRLRVGLPGRARRTSRPFAVAQRA